MVQAQTCGGVKTVRVVMVQAQTCGGVKAVRVVITLNMCLFVELKLH